MNESKQPQRIVNKLCLNKPQIDFDCLYCSLFFVPFPLFFMMLNDIEELIFVLAVIQPTRPASHKCEEIYVWTCLLVSYLFVIIVLSTIYFLLLLFFHLLHTKRHWIYIKLFYYYFLIICNEIIVILFQLPVEDQKFLEISISFPFQI